MDKLRVAIVDDEPEISMLIKMRLEKSAPHIEIIMLEGAKECLEYIGHETLDCILTDYQMPNMDGMELLVNLRRMGNGTPVIFVTGQGNEAIAREAFKNGAYDYFSKEIGFAHFTRIINSIEQAVKHRRADEAKELAEKNLHEEKNKLQSILHNIGDGISIQDMGFRVLYQNPVLAGFVGEHTGEICYKAYDKTDSVCEGCPVAATFEDGRSHTLEKIKGEPPNQRFFEIKASPLRDADGNIIAGIESVREVTSRRRMEAALRESERFLSNIFTSFPDGISIIDTEYNILRVNHVIEGWFPHAMPLIGKKCYTAFHGRDSVCEGCPSEKTFETGEPTNYIRPRVGPEGEVTGQVDLSAFPFIDEMTGQMKGVIEYARLIPPSAGETHMSRTVLENIVEAIRFGMIIVGRDRVVRFANPAALSMMGLSDEGAIVGKLCHKSICPAEEGRCPILDLGQKVDVSEKFLLDKDGASLPILKTVTPINLEGEEVLLETFVDIRDQKNAQAEAAKTRAFLQSVIDGAADPIMVIGMDYSVSLMNRAALRLSSYTESASDNIKCYQLSHGLDKPCSSEEGHECPLEEVKKTRASTTVVHKHMGPGGHDVWMEITASPMFDEKGDVASVIESSRDITDRKNIEKQRSDFYAMVTHDLRGSLTTILGYSELLASEKASCLDTQAKDMLTGIQRSAGRLNSMVDSYLTFTKLEDGHAQISKGPVDAGSLLQEAAAEYAKLADGKGLGFDTVIEDGLPKVNLDAVYVQRAISNLIENAINYTPSGGRITIGAKKGAAADGSRLVIYVSDTGPGVPEQEREKIFDKYYRSSRVHGVKGSGLGLAVVKAVVEAHGGSIELDCPPGGGSTFKMVFTLT
jgi:PAS domain S-box-containing protein